MKSRAIQKAVKNVQNTWQLYLMIAVPFVLIIVFAYVPMYGVQIAFKNYKPTRGFSESEWVGLRYIAKFISSSTAMDLIMNTLLLNLYGLVFGHPLPIIFALALNYVKRTGYQKCIQTITYAPHFISTVVIVGIVKQMFGYSYGIVNYMIEFLGGSRIDFIGDAQWFRTMYIGSDLWQGLGWSSIIYLSALSGIDPQLHEAARIDGASIVQRMWHIDIPGILPTIVILLIMSFGGFMSVGFEKVYLMQYSTNLEVTETINTYVYKVGMEDANYSFATAIGLFQSLVGFVLIMLVNTISKKLTETSLW